MKILNKYLSTVIKITDLLYEEITKIDSAEIYILDIGCGPSDMWEKVSKKLPINTRKRITLTMFDAETSLITNLNLGFKQVLIQKGLAPDDLSKFKDDQFDLVICFNLIEHLSKSMGYLLLYQIDRISCKSKIIYTPNGFVLQPPAINAQHNSHISGWQKKDFKQFGYRISIGQVGLKFLFGPYAKPKYSYKIIYKLSGLLYPLIQRFPKYCFSIVYISRNKLDVQKYI